jgi:hypothetical protein
MKGRPTTKTGQEIQEHLKSGVYFRNLWKAPYSYSKYTVLYNYRKLYQKKKLKKFIRQISKYNKKRYWTNKDKVV